MTGAILRASDDRRVPLGRGSDAMILALFRAFRDGRMPSTQDVTR